MANRLYPTARSALLRGEINWEADAFRAYALTSAYTFDVLHDNGADLTGILVFETLTGTAVLDDGIADCNDFIFTGIAMGDILSSIVIVKWSGSLATSELVYYGDQSDDGTPITRTSDGTGISILVSSFAERLFKI